MTHPEVQFLTQVIAERALNSIFGGMVIAVFAWLLLRIAGRQNSGTRFAVWFAALVAIAAQPFFPRFSSTAMAAHAMRAEIMLPNYWAAAILSVWSVFGAVAAVRIGIGLWNLRRLRTSATALERSRLQPALLETLARCEATRRVTVCTSSRVDVPTAIGFFRPTILLPEWSLQELPTEDLRIILLHECAHLRRWDDWTNLAQKIVRTVFFFHPAVWWIERRLSLEREMACDDAVLAETRNPCAYAECLVSLAERNFVRRSLAMAQAAISRACDTSRRVAEILNGERPRGTRVFNPAVCLMTLVAGLCTFALSAAPRLVAFRDSVQPSNFVNATAATDSGEAPQAAAVPVSMHTASAAGTIRRPAVSRADYSGKAANRAYTQISSRTMATQAQTPAQVVLAKAANDALATPHYLVVMQTAQFDDRGFVVVNVSVWDVTVYHPRQNPNQGRFAAKSI